MKERNDNKRGKEIQQSELPEDLITQQILSWLPIKPLTRFKVISKHWYSTISSPNFILRHTKQPLISHSVPPVETLLIQSDNDFYLYSCDSDDNVVKDPTYNEENSLIKLNKSSISIGDMFDCGDDKVVNLVGSANGLVCLGELYGEFFILWNPNTNQFHKYYPGIIEDCEVVTTIESSICWGFGHVSSLDDYKVIRVLLVYKRDFGDCVGVVDVYSLRSNTSKRVEVGAPKISGDRPRLVNDTFYWITWRGKEIVGYDVVRKKIVTYDPHLTLCLGCPSSDFVCVMGGSLTVYTRNSRNERVLNIVKSISTGGVVSIIPCEEQHFSDLVGFTKTGNMFFALQDSASAMLGLFDPTHNVTQSLLHFVPCERIHVAPYNSTLISPLPPPELPPIATVQVP